MEQLIEQTIYIREIQKDGGNPREPPSADALGGCIGWMHYGDTP